MTKTVFRVSDKARLKPISSATEISYNIEIPLVASFGMILSNKQTLKALIRLCRCPGWSAPLLFANPRRQVFSRRGPIMRMVECSNHSRHCVLHWTMAIQYQCLVQIHPGKGSAVTRDQRAPGSSLTGVTVLWSLSKTHLS